MVIGAALVVIGWMALSGTLDLDRQTGFVILGLVGTMLALAGLGGALLGGMRAIRDRRAVVVRCIALLAELTAPAAAPGPAESALLSGDGMTHFHRADCLLAEGKSLRAADADGHRAAGRRPCPVCLP